MDYIEFNIIFKYREYLVNFNVVISTEILSSECHPNSNFESGNDNINKNFKSKKKEAKKKLIQNK